MYLKTRLGVLGAAAAAVAGFALAAPAASAGVTPTPEPSIETFSQPPVPVQQCTLPTERQFFSPVKDGRDRRCQQEDFAVQFSSFNRSPLGRVLGSGPVALNLGFDRSLSPTLDLVSDRFGDSFLARHGALFGAVIDRNDCSITFDESDQPIQFAGRSGIWANLTGNGLYNLVGLFSFPTDHFRCTLPVGLTSAQADRDLNRGIARVAGVDAVDFAVDINGEAAVSLHRVRVLFPVPTPTRSFFAPTDGPTNS